MSHASRLPHWSKKHALWAVVGGAALASSYYVYYLYRYQGEHLVEAARQVAGRLAYFTPLQENSAGLTSGPWCLALIELT